MFPLLAAGAGLLGSVFSSFTSADNTNKQMAMQQQMQAQSEQFNAQEAEKNRDFQQQMSNTAYQRASADMKSAGLNPMMMFGSGSAASSPSGSTASVSTPSVPTPQNKSVFAGIGDVAEKYISTVIQQKTAEKMSDEIANLKTTNEKLNAEIGRTYNETATERERAEFVRAQTVLEKLRADPATVSAKEADAILNISPSVREKLVQAGYIADKSGKVLDTAGSAVGTALRAALTRKAIKEPSFKDRYYFGE